MPELPEVETVKIGLKNLIINKVVLSVESNNPKSFPNSSGDVNSFLLGAKITDVRRRGKALMIDLSSGYTLLIHLKMTGQLVFDGKKRFGAGHPNDSLIHKLPDSSTRVIFDFGDNSKLYFNDQRKFGWVKLVPSDLIHEVPFIAKLGPEPLEDAFTEFIFMQRLKRRPNTSIKAALLDQTVLAGVGNIYADEALWGAKIHPSTLVKQVSKKQAELLYDEIRYILNLSIEKGGSSNRNYVNAEGKKGSFTDFARVFRRDKEACPRCGDTIIKLRVAGRGTHICPTCQVLK